MFLQISSFDCDSLNPVYSFDNLIITRKYSVLNCIGHAKGKRVGEREGIRKTSHHGGVYKQTESAGGGRERGIYLVGQGNTNCKNTRLPSFWKVNKLLASFCLWSSVSGSFVCGREGWRGAGGWWGPGCARTLSRVDGLCAVGIPLALPQRFSLSCARSLVACGH